MDHKSTKELVAILTEAAIQVQVGGKYSHYKSSDSLYIVKDLGILEANNSVCVIYESLTLKGNPVFVRPLSEWIETVDWQGQKVPRFSKTY